jgi:hypothetical protein
MLTFLNVSMLVRLGPTAQTSLGTYATSPSVEAVGHLQQQRLSMTGTALRLATTAQSFHPGTLALVLQATSVQEELRPLLGNGLFPMALLVEEIHKTRARVQHVNHTPFQNVLITSKVTSTLTARARIHCQLVQHSALTTSMVRLMQMTSIAHLQRT